YAAAPALDRPDPFALRLEDGFQLGRERKRAALAVLRFARLQPYPAVRKIDVAPLPGQKLRFHAPSGDIADGRDRLEIVGQVTDNRSVLLGLEKSLPRVIDVQHRDFRPHPDLAGARAEPEASAQNRHLIVDRRGLGVLGEPMRRERCHPVAGNVARLALAGAEKCFQVNPGILDAVQTAPRIRLVVRLDHREQIADRRTIELRPDRLAGRCIAEFLFQQSNRGRPVLGVRVFGVSTAVDVVDDPPRRCFLQYAVPVAIGGLIHVAESARCFHRRLPPGCAFGVLRYAASAAAITSCKSRSSSSARIWAAFQSSRGSATLVLTVSLVSLRAVFMPQAYTLRYLAVKPSENPASAAVPLPSQPAPCAICGEQTEACGRCETPSAASARAPSQSHRH